MPCSVAPTMALIASMLAIGSSQAQESPAPIEKATGETFVTQVPPGGFRASKLVGVEVIGMDHTHIGKTEDVILDGEGRVRAVVIGIGGFLGLGEKRVAVPFDRIAWNTGDETIADATGPRSSTTPATAPSEDAAAKAGPDTMPGAKVSNEVLDVFPAGRSGTVTDATGSVTAREPRETATVATVGSGSGPIRAEIRFTKAALHAAPAFRYDADAKP